MERIPGRCLWREAEVQSWGQTPASVIHWLCDLGPVTLSASLFTYKMAIKLKTPASFSVPIKTHTHTLWTLRPHIRPPSLGVGKAPEFDGAGEITPSWAAAQGEEGAKSSGQVAEARCCRGTIGEVKAGAEAR